MKYGYYTDTNTIQTPVIIKENHTIQYDYIYGVMSMSNTTCIRHPGKP